MDGFESSTVSVGSVSSQPQASGFEAGMTDGGEVSQVEVFDQEAVGVGNSDPKDPVEEIMKIPGTSHDKLGAISEMDEAENSIIAEGLDSAEPIIASEEPIEVDEEPRLEEEKPDPITDKVMLLQAEAIKLLSNNIEGKLDKQGKHELVEKIRDVLGELDKKEHNNKEFLLSIIIGVIRIMFDMTEDGIETVEKQSKVN